MERLPDARFQRSLIVAALLAGFVLALALAASSRLHELAHPDADHRDHECAVTMMLTGGCDNAPAPQISAAIYFSRSVALLAAHDEHVVSAVATHRFGRGPPALG